MVYAIMRHKRAISRLVLCTFHTCHLKVVDKPNQPSMAGETVRATLETIVHVLAHGESYAAQDITYTTPHE